MNFYFNADENICGDEMWVAKRLHVDYPDYTVKEHIEQLHDCREWCGWYACEVCDVIRRALTKM